MSASASRNHGTSRNDIGPFSEPINLSRREPPAAAKQMGIDQPTVSAVLKAHQLLEFAVDAVPDLYSVRTSRLLTTSLDSEQSVNNSLPNTMYQQGRTRATGTKNQQDRQPALTC